MARFTTVGEVIDWYLTSDFRDLAEKSTIERCRLWRLFKLKFGEQEIAASIPADLLHFIGSQLGCKSNHTRRRIKATINRPFNAAATMGLISGNPFRGVKVPKGRRGRDWTEDQYQAVLRSSEPHFRRLVVFLRFSGARPGEGRLLEWSHILWGMGVCVLEEHKTASTADESRRIHFNAVTFKLLTWMSKRATSGRVFTDVRGNPWTIGSLVKYMIRVRDAENLPPSVKLHGLRHTFATRAIMNGVDIQTVADLLSHKSIQTTQQYEHLVDKRDWMNAAANRAVGHNPDAARRNS